MNNNIQESYCSFEVCKKLKEKGFNCIVDAFYDMEGDLAEEATPSRWNDHNAISRPTHAVAIEWIRVNFRTYIWIQIRGNSFNQTYVPFCMENLNPNNTIELAGYPILKEATDAALVYVLENLI